MGDPTGAPSAEESPEQPAESEHLKQKSTDLTQIPKIRRNSSLDTKELLKTVVKAADDKRAEEIVVLNMQGISLIADYFLICHGNSEKQVQAIAREIKDEASKVGYVVNKMEGIDEAKWVLVDMGNIIAHVFHRDERSYYNLERLWGDAPIEDVLGELES
ncbi:ribosome silencing factor [Bacillus sp. FJAT-49732]|uniref:Ribosomal silencing factor RsfS n=1 Tax=Lederbergia citrisecunda TaxID=2833583 RepID=A0A942TKF5_9BACI|nr:ribosome silencing factor [Lederbergia citrisecunda]